MIQNVKRRLFLNGLFIGSVLILSIVVSFLISAGIVFFAQRLGITSLGSSWSLLLINSIITFLMYFVCFLLLKFLDKRKVYEIASLNSPTDSAVQGVLFILGCTMIANYITAILNDLITQTTGFEATQPDVLEEATSSPLDLVFKLLTVAIIPALLEEFAFRGMLLGVLRKFGNWPAIIISSIIFALFHGNFIQIPFAFIFGFAAAIVVIITDSIWPAIIAHVINNSISVISLFSLSDQAITYLSYLIIFFVFAAVLSLIYFVFAGKIKKLNKKGNASIGTAFVYTFISPTVLIFVAYEIFSALLSRA